MSLTNKPTVTSSSIIQPPFPYWVENPTTFRTSMPPISTPQPQDELDAQALRRQLIKQLREAEGELAMIPKRQKELIEIVTGIKAYLEAIGEGAEEGDEDEDELTKGAQEGFKKAARAAKKVTSSKKHTRTKSPRSSA